MKILEYIKSMEVSKDILDKIFYIVSENEFLNGADMSKCPQCNNDNIIKLAAHSWTSSLLCRKCNTISFVIRADRQSGNCSETVFTYGDKQQ